VGVAVLSAIENEAEALMADTIKTETTLIEEGTLMLESLQFESEPWTSFYTVGVIIRELRKASGKQNKYGSEGDKAHSVNVIDHEGHPRDVDRLPKDDPNGGTGLLGAPECGDAMKLQMKINSETQVIEEAEVKTFGCGSAIASSSLANEWVKGKTSRKHWPSRTRISSARSAFPRATLLDARRYSRIGGRLHLVGSPIF
jgi:NifU-like N terminal domain